MIGGGAGSLVTQPLVSQPSSKPFRPLFYCPLGNMGVVERRGKGTPRGGVVEAALQ